MGGMFLSPPVAQGQSVYTAFYLQLAGAVAEPGGRRALCVGLGAGVGSRTLRLAGVDTGAGSGVRKRGRGQCWRFWNHGCWAWQSSDRRGPSGVLPHESGPRARCVLGAWQRVQGRADPTAHGPCHPLPHPPDVLELYGEVLDAAHRYFGLQRARPGAERELVGDALASTGTLDDGVYDYVIHDVYSGASTPRALISAPFFRQLASKMAGRRSVLALNFYVSALLVVVLGCSGGGSMLCARARHGWHHLAVDPARACLRPGMAGCYAVWRRNAFGPFAFVGAGDESGAPCTDRCLQRRLAPRAGPETPGIPRTHRAPSTRPCCASCAASWKPCSRTRCCCRTRRMQSTGTTWCWLPGRSCAWTGARDRRRPPWASCVGAAPPACEPCCTRHGPRRPGPRKARPPARRRQAATGRREGSAARGRRAGSATRGRGPGSATRGGRRPVQRPITGP